MTKIKKLILSYSVLNEYRKCPQSFAYRYLKGLVKPTLPSMTKGSPLTFGTLIHKFLELYHGGTPGHEALQTVLALGADSGLQSVDPGEQRSLLHLELLASTYLQKHPDPYADFRPITIEGKVALEYENDFLFATLPNGAQVIWRQHFDGVVEATDLSILEHKTASGNLLEGLVERMLPNDQAVGYVYGARRGLNLDVKGVLFNGLCTYRSLVNPSYKARPGAKNANQPLFHRQFVPIEAWMLQEWEAETLRTIKRLVEDIEDNLFTKNAPDSCTVFNSRCKFADLCKVDMKNRTSLIELMYDIEPWKGFSVTLDE